MSVLKIKPKTKYFLGKCSITEVHSQLQIAETELGSSFFSVNKVFLKDGLKLNLPGVTLYFYFEEKFMGKKKITLISEKAKQ